MLTSGQVARLTGHTRHHILCLARRGELPYHTNRCGQAVYDEQDVLKFLLHKYQPPALEGEWGMWFAGITDGEGSFSIAKGSPTGHYYQANYSLSLRVDDAQVLYDIQKHLQLGNLYDKAGHTNFQGYTSHPGMTFMVSGLEECYRLVQIFDRYPLRSKKALDFAIWKEFVTFKMSVKWKKSSVDRTQEQELYKQLRAAKAYQD
jgi:hypothetical protein